MTVRELVKLLKKYPQDLPVAYHLWSEQMMLEEKDVRVESLCEPRADGWVANKRPDKPFRDYLIIN